MFRLCLPALVVLLAAMPGASASEAAASQPAYFQLVLELDDHLNFDLTLDRLDRTLTLMEQLRRKYPGLEPVCLINVSGNVSDWLASVRGTSPPVQKLFRMLESGAVEIGYYGQNEPVETQWPQFNFRRKKSPDARWEVRSQALELFLSEFKSPRSGEPDPDRSGGLKRTLEVFPRVAMVSGVARELGGDPELAGLLQRWGVNAMLPGLLELNHPMARNLNGYRGALPGFAELMSVEPGLAPQLYWQDGVLRLSDAVAGDQGVLRITDEKEAFAKRLASMRRHRPQVLRILISPPVFHLKPEAGKEILESPLRWALANSKPAAVSQDLYLPREGVEAQYAKQTALLEYLCDEWMDANPGSRFLSASALLAAAGEAGGSPMSRQHVREAAADLLRRWGGSNHPPVYAAVGGRYLSLAEMFDYLTAALADERPVIASRRIGGVDVLTDDEGPAGVSVTRQQITEAARALSAQFDRPLEQQPMQARRVPGTVGVGSLQLNAAQFLYLMAELAAEPRGQFAVRASQMWHAAGMVLPSTRPPEDRGTVWTLKPAAVRWPNGRASASN